MSTTDGTQTRVLVTGANRGLGRALALELSRRGLSVIATARKVDELDALPVAQRLRLDVTDPESVASAAAAAGRVDVLINNAGLSVGAAVEDTPAAAALAVLDTNVVGPMRLISAFLPAMRAHGGGTVVTISSAGARACFPLNGISGASKCALEAVSETLALEAGPFGIRVLILQLGSVGTDMFTRQDRYVSPAYEHLDRAQREAYAAGQGRGADPADVASAIADAIESPTTPLRHPIGDDAAGIVAQRAEMTDAQWIARLTQVTGPNPSTASNSRTGRDPHSRDEDAAGSRASNAAVPIARATVDAGREDRPILVVGGTGKTGRRVAARLRAQGVPVRVGSRTGQPRFDWEDRSTWAPVLQDLRAAYVPYPDLITSTATRTTRDFAELAIEHGVTRLVMLTGRGEDEAQRAEREVQDAGAELTVLRCSWFMQIFSEDYLLDSIRAGTVVLPADDTQLDPFVDADDIADVAVAALTQPGHTGEVYELTGPRLLSFPDAVAEIAQASGREIAYTTVPAEDYATGAIDQGVPPELATYLVYLFRDVLGSGAHLTDGVQRAIGRPPRDFAQYVAGAASAWTPVVDQ